MIYPIVCYGNPILRNVALPIKSDYGNLSNIISNMWATLYATKGVGLAAPQIGLSIRLFLVDSAQMFSEDKKIEKKYPDAPGIKQVFINPTILSVAGEDWAYEEGCLSIPYVKTNVIRKQHLTMEYYDTNFVKHISHFTGISARIIFHEYDHIEGKLFIDRITPLKKKIFASKLSDIEKKKVDIFYKITY